MTLLNNIKFKVFAAFLLLVISFCFGRYSSNVDIQKKETDIAKEDKAVDKNAHVVTTTTTTKKPDGTEVTTTNTTKDINSVTKDDKTVVDKSSETEKSGAKTNVSLFYGYSFNKHGPLYGGSVTHEVLGPITVGIWGTTETSAGVSLGVSF